MSKSNSTEKASSDATPICESASPTRVRVAFRSGVGIEWREGRVIGQRTFEDTGETLLEISMNDGSFARKLPRDVRIVVEK